MRARTAPFFAEWILRHFAAGPHSDVIAGDLLEHYRNGRTRSWYWFQVFTAIFEGVYSDVRDNTLVVFRAITAGMLVLFLWNQVILPVLLQWVWLPLFSGPPFNPKTMWVDVLIYAAIVVFSGSVIARFGGAQRASAVLICMGSFLAFAMISAGLGFPQRLLLSEYVLSGAITLGIGWIVARLGYVQRTSSVFVFVSAFLILAALDSWRYTVILRIGGFYYHWDQYGWVALTALLLPFGSELWTRHRSRLKKPVVS